MKQPLLRLATALWISVLMILLATLLRVEAWILISALALILCVLVLIGRGAVRRLPKIFKGVEGTEIRWSIFGPISVGMGAWLYFNDRNSLIWALILGAALFISASLIAFGVRYGCRKAPYVVNISTVNASDLSQPVDRTQLSIGLYGAGLFLAATMPALGLRSGSITYAVVSLAVLGVLVTSSMIRQGFYLKRVERQIARLAPVFALVHDRKSTVVSHLAMWLKYFDRVGVPYIQIVVTKEMLDTIKSSGSTVPTIAPRDQTEDAVAEIIPASVKTIFYMRNGELNRTLIATLPRQEHVFLHHGDGDKPANSRPSHGLHDKILVAGQAAVDRYARRGVSIPAERFEISGRPQASDFKEADKRMSQIPVPTILYAPTWKGISEKVNFSSLHIGSEIVEQILKRGCRVIFRPHILRQDHPPHAKAIQEIGRLLAEDTKETGVEHLWGAEAEQTRTLAEVANLSDAMVADVSGVVTDYRQSGKPFAMVSTKLGIEAFHEQYPSSASAYVIDSSDMASIGDALEDMLREDPLSELRAKDRDYYLGGFNGRGAEDNFIDFLRRMARP